MTRLRKFVLSKPFSCAGFRPARPPDSARWVVAGVAVLLALVGGACGGAEGDPNPTVGSEPRIISQVLGSSSSGDLEIRWFQTSCESFERLDVSESETEVGIEITVLVDAGKCDNPEGPKAEASTMLTLAEPLADRIIIDENLGSTVKLNAEPGPPDQ